MLFWGVSWGGSPRAEFPREFHPSAVLGSDGAAALEILLMDKWDSYPEYPARSVGTVETSMISFKGH